MHEATFSSVHSNRRSHAHDRHGRMVMVGATTSRANSQVRVPTTGAVHESSLRHHPGGRSHRRTPTDTSRRCKTTERDVRCYKSTQSPTVFSGRVSGGRRASGGRAEGVAFSHGSHSVRHGTNTPSWPWWPADISVMRASSSRVTCQNVT